MIAQTLAGQTASETAAARSHWIESSRVLYSNVLVALSITIAILSLALVITIGFIWSVTRRPDGEWSGLEGLDCTREGFAEMVAYVTMSPMRHGNRLTLLQNGDAFFDAVRKAIKEAQQTVHFETFLWKTGELSATLVECFCERARAGVTVRMVIDAEGGKLMSQAERKTLRDSGVELCFVHPRSWRHLGTYNLRDHRKLLIIDAKLAFVGGHCITDKWRGNARGPGENRDLSVRVEGPIVNDVQMVFTDNWTAMTEEILAQESLFVPQEKSGDANIAVVFNKIERRVSPSKAIHMIAIASAQESVTIQNPYFLPDDNLCSALKDAVARGVKVRIMTPTLEATDNPLPFRAMRDLVRPLLEAGVEIWGYERTLLHQKTLMVDGFWSFIGTANIDLRSFEINDEITLSVFDEAFTEQLTQCFEDDLADCRRFTTDDLDGRKLIDRVRDRLAWSVREQL